MPSLGELIARASGFNALLKTRGTDEAKKHSKYFSFILLSLV